MDTEIEKYDFWHTKKRLNSYNGISDSNSIYSDAFNETVNQWWQLSRLDSCSIFARATGEKEIRLLSATMVCLGFLLFVCFLR